MRVCCNAVRTKQENIGWEELSVTCYKMELSYLCRKIHSQVTNAALVDNTHIIVPRTRTWRHGIGWCGFQSSHWYLYSSTACPLRCLGWVSLDKDMGVTLTNPSKRYAVPRRWVGACSTKLLRTLLLRLTTQKRSLTATKVSQPTSNAYKNCFQREYEEAK